MGQRANYILINGDRQEIFYNHWRANSIGADLYLGEQRFLDFVQKCKPVDVLLDEVWIEGCVVINLNKRQLHFWSLELGYDSAVEFYLSKLIEQWPQWDITLVKNKMYDIQQVLGIDYLSRFEWYTLPPPVESDVILDETEDDYSAVTVVIKSDSQVHITQTSKFNLGAVLNYGSPVIELLLSRRSNELHKEGDINYFEVLVIDTIQKKVIIDQSEFGLLEQTQAKWDGYEMIMGDFGYIGALKMAGIDTINYVMSPVEIKEKFQEITKQDNGFDPKSFARELLATTEDVQFNPDFFDTTKPSKTFLEKIKVIWQNLKR